MTKAADYPRFDVSLSAEELYLIAQSLRETIEQLGRQRMILLDNGKIASYEAMVKKTVDHEMLLAKLQKKEL